MYATDEAAMPQSIVVNAWKLPPIDDVSHRVVLGQSCDISRQAKRMALRSPAHEPSRELPISWKAHLIRQRSEELASQLTAAIFRPALQPKLAPASIPEPAAHGLQALQTLAGVCNLRLQSGILSRILEPAVPTAEPAGGSEERSDFDRVEAELHAKAA